MQFYNIYWYQKAGPHSVDVHNHVNIISLLMIMLIMRISLNF